jgi:cystathionine gamma-synthase
MAGIRASRAIAPTRGKLRLMSTGDRGGLHSESWLTSTGRGHDIGAPLNTPLVPASNFRLGGPRGYARGEGTPTWDAFEQIIGGLEGGEAIAFASGMGAIAAVFAQLSAGARIVLPDDCYQGVVGLAEIGQAKAGWVVQRLAVDDTAGWVRACATADLIWLESPSNPLLVVADVKTICAAARKPDSLLVVDNTFATPLNQRPLTLGADISVQSATKLIGGHSDLLAGVASTHHPVLAAALRHTREISGATPGALEMFLAVRGARTLALRLQRAQETAMTLAGWLEVHPRVRVVRYPGLTTHPTHEVARQQLQGFGTVISFDVDGDSRTADRVCEMLRLVQHATSLGSVESTIERRAAVPGQEHLPATLLRLSVGIEHVTDLKADFDQALQRAAELV